MSKDQIYLDQAIDQVSSMLRAKKDIWTSGAPVFENFDMMSELQIEPLAFAVAMCRLKMNRLKSRIQQHPQTHDLVTDPDFEDSLVDLASYALLALGISKRERNKKSTIDAYVDAYIKSDAGKADIAEMAQKLMGEKTKAEIFEDQMCGGDLEKGREEIQKTAAEMRGIQIPPYGLTIKNESPPVRTEKTIVASVIPTSNSNSTPVVLNSQNFDQELLPPPGQFVDAKVRYTPFQHISAHDPLGQQGILEITTQEETDVPQEESNRTGTCCESSRHSVCHC